ARRWRVQPVTDLQSRRISRDVFEGLLQADPEVGTFLTEIVADPFGVTWGGATIQHPGLRS
ncbi:MAG: hypothetical protein WCD46_11130, partial [Desulfobacterales bacterium]